MGRRFAGHLPDHCSRVWAVVAAWIAHELG